jgi:hypothetical protein
VDTNEGACTDVRIWPEPHPCLDRSAAVYPCGKGDLCSDGKYDCGIDAAVHFAVFIPV